MWLLKCHHVKIYHPQTSFLTTSYNVIREMFPFSSFHCEFGTAVLQGRLTTSCLLGLALQLSDWRTVCKEKGWASGGASPSHVRQDSHSFTGTQSHRHRLDHSCLIIIRKRPGQLRLLRQISDGSYLRLTKSFTFGFIWCEQHDGTCGCSIVCFMYNRKVFDYVIHLVVSSQWTYHT